jgi:hypothetical protein
MDGRVKPAHGEERRGGAPTFFRLKSPKTSFHAIKCSKRRLAVKGKTAATVFLALTIGAVAQTASRPPPFRDDIWQRTRDGLTSNDPAGRSATGPGQALAMAGREDLVTMPPVMARKACRPLLRDGRPLDPLTYIADAAAANAKVAMINEAHAEPLTRAFIAKVAAALRGKGYTAYAAETFTPDIAEKGSTPPLWSDGYYSREPIYGRLIRELRRLDYRLVAYEARDIDTKAPFPEQMQQRENQQAANLAAQVKRESGKVLVHVGQGHLVEAVNNGTLRLMGTVFKQDTGIDPLTIDLTWNESPTEDFVICDPASVTARNVDIYIGVPKLRFQRLRPSWRQGVGDQMVDIPAVLWRQDQIAIYEVRRAGEPAEATPIERLLLRPGENLPLLLPPGSYTASVWTEKEGWSASTPIVVVMRVNIDGPTTPGDQLIPQPSPERLASLGCPPLPPAARVVRSSRDLPGPVQAALENFAGFRHTGLSCNYTDIQARPVTDRCFIRALQQNGEWIVQLARGDRGTSFDEPLVYRVEGDRAREIGWRNGYASLCTLRALGSASFPRGISKEEGKPAVTEPSR